MLAQTAPHIGYVFPAGGQQGAKFQARIGGQFMDGATNVYVSGGGVQAAIEEYSRPMTAREFNELRKEAEELRTRREAARKAAPNGAARKNNRGSGWTAADERAFNEIRQKIAKYQRRPANPAIAETLTLTLNVAPDAAPGSRELRLRTGSGLSNPLVFQIGQLPEVAAKPAQALEEPRRARFERAVVPSAPQETRLTAPVVANGQIMPGEVDRFKFHARAGQKLVLAVSARELIPYLPDAVPGWFQATLAIYDSNGRELAFDDDFRFNPDPVLFFQVPKEGDYAVEIKDSIYRGREDFVYRLSIGELPFLTGIYPLGGRAGVEAVVEAKGWNIDGQTLRAPAVTDGMVQSLAAAKGDLKSNPLPFARDTDPDAQEREPNDTVSQAQQVVPSVIVNGRIDTPGDADVFRFSGKAGTEIVAEVMARRLSSPLDSLLRLTDSSGKQIAANDDFEDKGAGLTTHQADSRISVKLPQDGVYFLRLSDAQRKGGSEYAYRLRIGEPRPDFELRVAPSSVSVRPGASMPLTVYALRKDGFTNEIMLALDDGGGFSIDGGRVPANAEQVRITLTAPAKEIAEPVALKIEGRGVVGGKVLTRPVVPSEDMMQAFFYRHLVPSKELLVCVNGNRVQRWPAKLATEVPVRIPCGGVARVRVTASKAALTRVKLELSNPPDGISIEKVGSWESGVEIFLACDAEKAKPGSRGNLIVQPAPAKAQGNRPAGGQAGALGSLPAIPYEIVEKNQ